MLINPPPPNPQLIHVLRNRLPTTTLIHTHTHTHTHTLKFMHMSTHIHTSKVGQLSSERWFEGWEHFVAEDSQSYPLPAFTHARFSPHSQIWPPPTHPPPQKVCFHEKKKIFIYSDPLECTECVCLHFDGPNIVNDGCFQHPEGFRSQRCSSLGTCHNTATVDILLRCIHISHLQRTRQTLHVRLQAGNQ